VENVGHDTSSFKTLNPLTTRIEVSSTESSSWSTKASWDIKCGCVKSSFNCHNPIADQPGRFSVGLGGLKECGLAVAGNPLRLSKLSNMLGFGATALNGCTPSIGPGRFKKGGITSPACESSMMLSTQGAL
jgi:hypothetical protein